MGLLRRLFLGSGRLPDDLRAQLTGEGLVLLEEELPGSITYRNYRAPRRRATLEKSAINAAIAITSQRVVVFIGGGKAMDRGKHMDVPFTDHRIRDLEVVAESPGKVRIAYNPAVFRPETSGRVELRLKTPHAPDIVALITHR
jgi:hypothetical protein